MRLMLALALCLALAGIEGCGEDQSPLPGKGQWRIVNYWAIWCVPCREEIPELNALNRDTPLVVLSVNYDNSKGEALLRQVRELGIEFPVLEQDPAPSLGLERPRVLPTTLLVDPKGVVTDTLVGPQTQETLIAVWKTRLNAEDETL